MGITCNVTATSRAARCGFRAHFTFFGGGALGIGRDFLSFAISLVCGDGNPCPSAMALMMSEKLPFRIRRGVHRGLPIEEITGASLGLVRDRGLIFTMCVAAAQMIKRYVCGDPVEPSVKAALKAEPMQIPIDTQESFLVNVPGIVGSMNKV